MNRTDVVLQSRTVYVFPTADTLILESTYGDRIHSGRRNRRYQLQQIIENALKNRGVILIPAFSIGFVVARLPSHDC